MTETRPVHYEIHGDVAVLTIDNPPVNALGAGVREGIVDAVRRANQDERVQALVLIGAGRHFIAGSDMRRFGTARPVSTRSSAAAIEASEKPVVAAIHGSALGGGLEHALACHYRIAAAGARMALPEVGLGLVPGGGGTQRLPRIVGVAAALELILTGRKLGAEEALRCGLIDDLVPSGDLRGAAIAFARRFADHRPLPRARDRVPAAVDPGFFDDTRKAAIKKYRHLESPAHAIACVEASTRLPFDEGMALEQRTFESLENADQAKALRYAFFAEREAAKIPGVPSDYVPPAIRTAAVIGAGTMGSGIAISFADAGIPVKILEISQEALDRGMTRVRDTFDVRVKRGSLSQVEMDRRQAMIEPVMRYEEIGQADVVIEAVFERIDLKKDVFTRLDTVMKPGALLLTNSSAIDIDTMADATHRPGDVAGAHFFAPANVMKLCEIVRGDRSRIETIVRASKLGRDLGKISVVAGSCDGFAANRSRAPLVTEMMLMLEEGALPEQVDRVVVAFGYPMGPFAVSDLSGLDVSYDTRKRRAAADPGYRKLHVPDRLVEMGRKGQKTQAGWYRYDTGSRVPLPDPVVAEVIAGVARDFGVEQRSFDDEEILHRLLFASVNEACKILEDGKAWRASDIDVMWLNGFGFPRHRGGLMFWADTVGAKRIAAQVQEWHARYGKRWKPSTLLEDVAAAGSALRDVVATT